MLDQTNQIVIGNALIIVLLQQLYELLYSWIICLYFTIRGVSTLCNCKVAWPSEESHIVCIARILVHPPRKTVTKNIDYFSANKKAWTGFEPQPFP